MAMKCAAISLVAACQLHTYFVLTVFAFDYRLLWGQTMYVVNEAEKVVWPHKTTSVKPYAYYCRCILIDNS